MTYWEVSTLQFNIIPRIARHSLVVGMQALITLISVDIRNTYDMVYRSVHYQDFRSPMCPRIHSHAPSYYRLLSHVWLWTLMH